MPYHHLTEQERYVICYMNMAGFSHAAIGRKLGRHRATIGRELQRNLGEVLGVNRDLGVIL